MITISDKTTRDELIHRINRLNENAGLTKVDEYLPDVERMTLYEGMSLDKNKYKQAFIGRLLGKMALKRFYKMKNPIKRNLPTHPEPKKRQKTNWLLDYKYTDHHRGQFNSFEQSFGGSANFNWPT